MAAGTPKFRVLDGFAADDQDIWMTLWNSSSNREVFANPNYASLFSSSASRPFCATYDSGDRRMILPFLLRSMPEHELQSNDLAGTTDIISPYGHGGPFLTGNIRSEELRGFWDQLAAWAREHRVVSEFLRLGLIREDSLSYPGQVVNSGFNVVRDLTRDVEELWMDVEHKVRKNVKKARRSGVTVKVDRHGDDLDAFVSTYHATMDRRDADRSYYFSHEFFERLRDTLEGNYAFFHAILDDVIVSTELVLISDENVYSFLGGTDPGAYSVRPNDLLKYTVVEWARAQGKKRFVLGGGYHADDGILRYKTSFAPQGRVPFYVGRRVLDERLYAAAVAAKGAAEYARTGSRWEPRTGFFPSYRA